MPEPIQEKNTLFSRAYDKLAPHFLRFETQLMQRVTKLKGTLYGILVIITFFAFSICGFDAYYDFFLIIELVLTLIVGYLILLHDCENIYHYVSCNYKAYHPGRADSSINEVINQQVMKDSFPYKVLLIGFVAFLCLLFVIFLLANFKADLHDPLGAHNHFFKWLFLAAIDGFRENHHKVTKLLHFGAGLAIMIFATHIISTLAFQRLTNLIEIVNSAREAAKFK